MVTRSQILAEVDSWLGTPYGHQQGIKGLAADCVHFIARMADDTKAVPDLVIPHDYKPREDGIVLMKLLLQYTEFIPDRADIKPADVVAFVDERRVDLKTPRHVGIVRELDPVFMIHASRYQGVCRQFVDDDWWLRFHSAWRIKNIVDE